MDDILTIKQFSLQFGESPYVPFYPPYGMTMEEYGWEVNQANERLDAWKANIEERYKEYLNKSQQKLDSDHV